MLEKLKTILEYLERTYPKFYEDDFIGYCDDVVKVAEKTATPELEKKILEPFLVSSRGDKSRQLLQLLTTTVASAVRLKKQYYEK